MSWRAARRLAWVPVLMLAGPAWVWLSGAVHVDAEWASADRHSAGLAPDPRTTPEAVVQVYAARAFRWRGLFAVHTWIATKAQGAPRYRVHEVIGWRARYNRPVVVSGFAQPDRRWFGNMPQVLVELRGTEAAAAIEAIEHAVAAYPHRHRYRVWPGPNSNTFTAHVLREVPALGAALPTTAVGKDYLVDRLLIAPAPSGSGYQVSLFGLLGLTLARTEGIELNLLGLNVALRVVDGTLSLPGVGTVSL